MENIDLILQLEEFYNSAWNKLIITGSVIFALFGILMPIIFQILQNRYFKLQEKELKQEIKDEIKSLKIELKNEIKAEYQNEIDKLIEDINCRSSIQDARALHLQGNSYLKSKEYILAITDFLFAIDYYLEGKDYDNFIAVVENITDNCLKNINKSDLNDVFLKNDYDPKEYFKNLKDNDKDNIVTLAINNLKFKVNKLLEI